MSAFHGQISFCAFLCLCGFLSAFHTLPRSPALHRANLLSKVAVSGCSGGPTLQRFCWNQRTSVTIKKKTKNVNFCKEKLGKLGLLELFQNNRYLGVCWASNSGCVLSANHEGKPNTSNWEAHWSSRPANQKFLKALVFSVEIAVDFEAMKFESSNIFSFR